MANAMLYQISNVTNVNPPQLTWQIQVVYVGSDVPSGMVPAQMTFSTSSNVTPAQLAAAAVSAIQAFALTRGFTVGAGATLMPSYSLI